ncbi:MAG: divalent-cation tolerance protein CutA [Firmicutes bacterium]|nr:divalent-cation tolerance protein CutA [Bacillota bacterium]
MKYCMIETAFDNQEELQKTIDKLLEDKLVGSCQVVESNSTWNWKNTLESAKEYLLFMKTKQALVTEVYEVIKGIHSYKCFGFTVFVSNSCNKDYLDWIGIETK